MLLRIQFTIVIRCQNFTYTVTDRNGNTLSEEEIASLGTISVVKTPEDVTPGHYTIKAQVENPKQEL